LGIVKEIIYTTKVLVTLVMDLLMFMDFLLDVIPVKEKGSWEHLGHASLGTSIRKVRVMLVEAEDTIFKFN